MLIWTEPAKKDVMDFISNAKFDTQKTVKNYFLKLSNYLEILNTMPDLGKAFQLFNTDFNIRQIIFKNHKVIYLVLDSDVYILAVLHSKMDSSTIIKKIVDLLD